MTEHHHGGHHHEGHRPHDGRLRPRREPKPEPHHPPIENTHGRPLALAFGLTAFFFLAELAGGLWTGSLALLSDAVHMGVDTSALGMSLLAARLKCLPPDPRRTFGYERIEVLAALCNGLLLLVATGWILKEAWERCLAPTPVLSGPMLAIAVAGLGVNLASGRILHRHAHENINVRGAFLHVLFDALGSVAAIAAAAVMLLTGWTMADPLASGFISILIVSSSLLLVRDSAHILLEGAPAHLDLDEIRDRLSGVPGVADVHDLHLWSLTRGSESLSGHVVLAPGARAKEVLAAGTSLLAGEFGLSHVTLQIEEPQ